MSPSRRIAVLAGPYEPTAEALAVLDLAVALARRGHRIVTAGTEGSLLPAFAAAGPAFPVRPDLLGLPAVAEARERLGEGLPEVLLAAGASLARRAAAIAHGLHVPAVVHVESPRIVAGLASDAVRAVTVPSRAVRDALLFRGVPPGRIRLLPPGIDPSRHPPPPAETPGAPPVLGCLCELRPDAGLGILLEAFPRIRAAAPETHLLVSGFGPREEWVRRRGREAGLSAAITVASPGAAAGAVLQTVSVFVLPATGTGHSRFLLEAMAAGLPAVATGVGGALALLREGETGVFVPPRDPGRLADAVLALLGDPPRRARMGAAARAAAATRPADAAASALETVLEDALRGTDLGTAFVAGNLAEADVVRGLLVAGGVEARIEGEESVAALDGAATGNRGVRILVAAEDLARADAVLREARSEGGAGDEEE